MFAIKGWCVTVATAFAGVAINKGTPLLIVTALTVTVCFWLLDSHFKSLQRRFIERDLDLEAKLKAEPVVEVLRASPPMIPGLASQFVNPRRGFWSKFAFEISKTWREARTAIVFNLYVLITVSLGVVTLLLVISKP